MPPAYGVRRVSSTSTLLPSIHGRCVGLFERPSKPAPFAPSRGSLSGLSIGIFSSAAVGASAPPRDDTLAVVGRIAAGMGSHANASSAAAIDGVMKTAYDVEGVSAGGGRRSPKFAPSATEALPLPAQPLPPFSRDASPKCSLSGSSIAGGACRRLPQRRSIRQMPQLQPVDVPAAEAVGKAASVGAVEPLPGVSPSRHAMVVAVIPVPPAASPREEPEEVTTECCWPSADAVVSSVSAEDSTYVSGASSISSAIWFDEEFGGSSSSTAEPAASAAPRSPDTTPRRCERVLDRRTDAEVQAFSADDEPQAECVDDEDRSDDGKRKRASTLAETGQVRPGRSVRKKRAVSKKVAGADEAGSKTRKSTDNQTRSEGRLPVQGAPGGPRLCYVVQFGNNSPLVREVLRLREGWKPGPGDPNCMRSKTNHEEKRVRMAVAEDLPEIQFLWTQYSCKDFLDYMASQQQGVCVIVNEERDIQIKLKKTAKSTAEAQEPVASTTASTASLQSHPMLPRVHNHFEGNGVLCRKCGLRDTMVGYYLNHGRDPFGVLPLAFVVKRCSKDPEFSQLCDAFNAISEHSGQCLWLVKPGEWANRGFGIQIYDSLEDITAHVDSKEKTWVVQKYLERPLLVHRRKFDIRAYCLVNQDPNGGNIHAFAYREAYLRTTSTEYTTKSLDRMVHLNNDAVQKKGDDYGKFESANKMSLKEFQRYLDEHHGKDRVNVQTQIVPQIRGLMADTVRAAAGQLNPRQIDHCFEVFGFDFMVDESYRVWLIEVNTNPCLETPCVYLSQLIPKMLDEALQLSLDSVYPQAAAPIKATNSDGGLGGWEPIFSGPASATTSSPSHGEVHCPWVPRAPPSFEGVQTMAGVSDFTALGRDLWDRSEAFQDELQGLASRFAAMGAERPRRSERRRSVHEAGAKAPEKTAGGNRKSKKSLHCR